MQFFAALFSSLEPSNSQGFVFAHVLSMMFIFGAIYMLWCLGPFREGWDLRILEEEEKEDCCQTFTFEFEHRATHSFVVYAPKTCLFSLNNNTTKSFFLLLGRSQFTHQFMKKHPSPTFYLGIFFGRLEFLIPFYASGWSLCTWLYQISSCFLQPLFLVWFFNGLPEIHCVHTCPLKFSPGAVHVHHNVFCDYSSPRFFSQFNIVQYDRKRTWNQRKRDIPSDWPCFSWRQWKLQSYPIWSNRGLDFRRFDVSKSTKRSTRSRFESHFTLKIEH